MPVEKDYGFETADGNKSLAELFDGRSQLLISDFMFEPAVAYYGLLDRTSRGLPRGGRGVVLGSGATTSTETA